jgi:CheY-like chemotaxis protein
VFTVELQSIPTPAAAQAERPTNGPTPSHVLIVEDNDDSREMLQTLLQVRGHRVDAAADGPEGVDLALSERPQIAFIDLGLPGFDGFEVARRIRNQLTPRDIVLVALSGYGSSQDKERSSQAGFDLHLVKPVSADTLSQVLSDTRDR